MVRADSTRDVPGGPSVSANVRWVWVGSRDLCDWKLGVSSATCTLISLVWCSDAGLCSLSGHLCGCGRGGCTAVVVQRSPKGGVAPQTRHFVAGLRCCEEYASRLRNTHRHDSRVRVDHRRHSSELDTRSKRSLTRRRCGLDRVHGGIRPRQSGYCKLTSRAGDRRTNAIELTCVVVCGLLGDPGCRPLVARAT